MFWVVNQTDINIMLAELIGFQYKVDEDVFILDRRGRESIFTLWNPFQNKDQLVFLWARINGYGLHTACLENLADILGLPEPEKRTVEDMDKLSSASMKDQLMAIYKTMKINLLPVLKTDM